MLSNFDQIKVFKKSPILVSSRYHPFTVLKKNRDCDWFKDDCDIKKVVTWWLITHERWTYINREYRSTSPVWKMPQILWSGKLVGTVLMRAEHKIPKIYALQTYVLFDTYWYVGSKTTGLSTWLHHWVQNIRRDMWKGTD